MTTPAYRAPDGPHWVKRARPHHTTVVDGRGVIWMVTEVRQGGRVIRWTDADGRLAVTVVAETHPDYPSDADVIAWERAERAAARANQYPYY